MPLSIERIRPKIDIVPRFDTVYVGEGPGFANFNAYGGGGIYTYSIVDAQSGPYATINSSTGAYHSGFTCGEGVVDKISVKDQFGNEAFASVSVLPWV